MATSLQQLLDDIATRTADRTGGAPPELEDAIGALGHAGRVLARLSTDGLDTQAASPREATTRDLAAACHTVAGLWPSTGGPLTDLMGAAADVAGRAQPQIGRAQRWAVCVQVAATADHCARLVHRLAPNAAVAELAHLHRLAAAVERDAQSDPPGAAAQAFLDRLVPMPALPSGLTGVGVAAEASAALVAAIDRADRRGGISLQELRAVTASTELSSGYATGVAAVLSPGDSGQPWQATALAWRVAGQETRVFEDGRRGGPTDVIAWANLIPDALSHDLGPVDAIDTPTLSTRDDLHELSAGVRRVANQGAVVAEQLAETTRRWAGEGQLHAYARHLPQMEDMPEDRVHDVIVGRRVRASGSDLNPLRAAIDRAGALSTALADSLNQATAAEPPAQPHLAALYASRARAPGSAERMTAYAREVEQALGATRTPFQSQFRDRGSPTAPDR